MHYPLDELIGRAREKHPGGQTLAIKRASWLLPRDGGDGLLMRLRLINASPEEYVGVGGPNLQSGLSAKTVHMNVQSQEQVSTTRLVPDDYGAISQREVRAVEFGGKLVIPKLEEIAVVGGLVPFEIGTGFVHVLEPDQIAQIF